MKKLSLHFEKGKTTAEQINKMFGYLCPSVHISMELFSELIANIDKDVEGTLSLDVDDNVIVFEKN